MNGVSSLITPFIFFGILILLFIIFRSVLLWFWKIDERVDLLKKNNRLLENLLNELRDDSSKVLLEKSIHHREKDEDKLSNEEEHNSIENLDKGSVNVEHLNRLIKKLKEDEVIIQDKETKKMTVIKKVQFEMDKELDLSHKYIVLYQK